MTSLKNKIRDNHLIIDQVIIGWYAMLSIECMSAGVPVICKIDKDLKNFIP